MKTPPNPRAFTLIEILLAMALFAIGFSMIAVMPGAATVMEQRFEEITEGKIAARNASAMVQARGAYWPMMEFAYSAHRMPCEGSFHPSMGTSALNIAAFDISSGWYDGITGGEVGGQLTSLIHSPQTEVLTTTTPNANNDATPGDADTQGDFEDFICNGSQSRVNGWGAQGCNLDTESDSFKKMADTNANNNWLAVDGGNDFYIHDSTANDIGDRTHFFRGQIHAYHNRLMPPWIYPMEIRSYPASLPLAKRRIFSSLAYVDTNLDLNRRSWVLYAVAHKRGEGDQWVEGASGNVYMDATLWPSGTPGLGANNTAVSAWGTGYPMLANAVGMADSLALASDFSTFSSHNEYNHSMDNRILNLGDRNRLFLWGGVIPMCNNNTQVLSYPTLMRLPAIIYDWNKSLIQVSYPREYVPGVASATASDRRLKVGDHMLSNEAGLHWTVKSIQSEVRPQYAAADRPFYQIVEVSPPLNQSPLGGPTLSGDGTGAAVDHAGNALSVPRPNDTLVQNQGHGANAYPYWRLRFIWFAPAPDQGTASSWSALNVIQGDAFMSANPNQ